MPSACWPAPSALATGTAYVDLSQDYYERASTARVVKRLSRRTSELGYQLVKHDPPHALAASG